MKCSNSPGHCMIACPPQSRKRIFKAEKHFITTVGLAELRFSEKMSCVAPVRKILNDKGKTCYAILNSPSSSVQITLSCCSLLSWTCSSEVDFLLRTTGNCFTLIKSLLFDIHSIIPFALANLYWTRCTFVVNFNFSLKH